MSPVRITLCPPTECVRSSARSPPWTPFPTRLATVPRPESAAVFVEPVTSAGCPIQAVPSLEWDSSYRASGQVRVGNQYVADESIEIRTSGNELAQSSPGRTEGIEF